MTPEQLAVLSDSLEAAGVSEEWRAIVRHCIEVASTVPSYRMRLLPEDQPAATVPMRVWALIQVREDGTHARNADAPWSDWLGLAAQILRLPQ